MDQGRLVGFGQRAANLPQDVDNPLLGLRAITFDQRLQCQAVEQLHRVIKHPFGGAAKVIDGDRIGMVQLAGQLHLALEPRDGRVGGLVRIDQLHSGRAAEHGVVGSINGSHSSRSDPLLEDILTEALQLEGRLAGSPLQAGHEHRIDEDGDRGQKQQREQPPEDPSYDGKRGQGLGQIHFGDDAEAKIGEPGPGPHRRHAAIIAVPHDVRAGMAGNHLGGRQRQGLLGATQLGSWRRWSCRRRGRELAGRESRPRLPGREASRPP